jgi:hypothetical protein
VKYTSNEASMLPPRSGGRGLKRRRGRLRRFYSDELGFIALGNMAWRGLSAKDFGVRTRKLLGPKPKSD